MLPFPTFIHGLQRTDTIRALSNVFSYTDIFLNSGLQEIKIRPCKKSDIRVSVPTLYKNNPFQQFYLLNILNIFYIILKKNSSIPIYHRWILSPSSINSPGKYLEAPPTVQTKTLNQESLVIWNHINKTSLSRNDTLSVFVWNLRVYFYKYSSKISFTH